MRVYWMDWGIDLLIPRGCITLRWRPNWALYYSPDGTPSHPRAKGFGR